MAERLGEDVVDAALAERHLDWRRERDELVKRSKRAGFPGALDYVNQVGALAEAANHHPDIDIRWDTVTLRLTTHDSGGLTEKDLSLAAQIDGLG